MAQTVTRLRRLQASRSSSSVFCSNSKVRGSLVLAFYYTAVIKDQKIHFRSPPVGLAAYSGYTVITKAAKEFTDAGGRRKVKGNMDIELAVDAMEIAKIVLFSGDGDFLSLVEAAQRRGVVSTISSYPPMVADELRRQTDAFTYLVESQSKFEERGKLRYSPNREARAGSNRGEHNA